MAIRVFPILGLLALLLSFGDVRAQHVQIERVATGGDQTRLTFTFTWPSTLQSALDSASVSSLDARAVAAATGTMFDASESVSLSQLGLPGATVVESAFDEVPLAPGSDVDSLLAWLTSPLVEAGWPGVSAGEVLATVRVRTVTYDPSREVLRRYRRVVVDVVPPAGSAGKTSASLLRADNPHLGVTRSVLADGYIIKIPVRTEGVYRINASYLNSALTGSGISVADLDPGSIKLYGNGGKPLPALSSVPRPADLVENPVLVTGSGNNLSIVFYARGPQGWTYESTTGRWIHHTHPFSNDNYYFLKVDAGSANGRRVGSASDPGSSGATVLSEVVGRHLKEYDDLMWSKDSGTGHTWVSQLIQSNQQFDVFANASLPGLSAGPVTYRARIAQRTHTSNRGPMVRFRSNGTVLASVAAGAVSRAETSPIARAAELEFTQENAAGSPLSLVMALDDHPEGPIAALDWIRVFYPQQLRATDGYLRFVTPADQSGVFEFVLSGFSTTPTVWDVTQIDDVRALNVTASGNAHTVRVDVTAGVPREIVAFTQQPLRVPEAPTQVPNQNLHGIASYPDFVIVVPDTFKVQAEELADRRRQEGLVVEIADVQHIYNEFSGGAPDMRAVRDYFKFIYDRGLEAGQPFRYALLFGDGHYNFRNLGSSPPELNNWIFPYETEESFDPIQSYTSDDYFGLLDDHEGIWPYTSQTGELGERVDIGIGRFTVQTAAEAQALIDKIKQYESPENRGAWRMRYTFVADDGHNGLAGNLENTPDLHTQNIDVVADQVLADYPLLNQKKIYGISYPRVFLTTWRQPEVRRDLLAAINSGSLIVNYSGHGGEDALAQEQIFTREDAASLTNGDRLPIVVTATCSFGRWDLSDDQSGAEVLHLNDRGGAVAMLTTVRLVYTSASTGSLNVGLNLALNRAMMQLDENGRPRRLGDIMRITKNTREGLDTNNRKFNLLGDPTMRVGLPAPRVAVETVNGQPLTDQPVPVRALDRVTITGSVKDASGNLDETFGGPVNLSVFDAERRIPVENASALRSGYYTVREDLIWRGEVKAEAGRYSATFVVPKDISYSNDNGKISAYALEDGVDAGGFTTNIVVGGSSANPPNDATGPTISLFMNDTTFVSGGMTTPNPELIVKLSDESGINTVGAGVGHEMLLVVDGNEQRATNIGEYYQSEENSYQRGTVRFPIDVYLKEQSEDRLAPGLHTVEVRAWDVLNNSSSASLDFYVAESEELALRNVLNYPNPLSRDTRFIFEHNKVPGTPARIQIRIYSLSGRPVRTLDREQTLPAGVLPGGQVDVYWDGRDEDYDLVGTGIYLYKVRVEVDNGDETEVVEHIEKLAVIR